MMKCLTACLLLTSLCQAQWVTFNDETSVRLQATPSLGSADVQEKDYVWADFDQDGDTDLVSVRKQPFTSTGRFPNVLFMNEGGVLVDRTATYATASNVTGSNGFQDDTNDRDVVAVDVNGDGWLDLVTATTRTGGFAKYISHPRVYMNQGQDGSGSWLGFIFDDENRIPTMPAEPRFCSVSAGDIDGDGDMDLYMGDYQQPESIPRSVDLNDRLFINDGTGYFTDESSMRMSGTMLESSFAMSTAIVDINGDGKLDIMKDDALNSPQGVSVSYNDGTSTGFFGTYDVAYSFAPYHIGVGDLNNDGRLDFIVSDDGADRYALNQGNDANGVAQFSTPTFSYSGGSSDDGFGGNNLIIDLNNDGWNEAIITDVDVDISGCNRRTHIYRNLGNAPNVTMQEQVVGGAVASIPTGMLTGTHDIAVFDIDGDGWNDMVIGRCTGTQVWMNSPPTGLSFSYPTGLLAFLTPNIPNTLQLQLGGIGGAIPGGVADLHYRVNGGPWVDVPMTSLGGAQFEASFPSFSCVDRVEYYISAEDSVGAVFNDPPAGDTGPYAAIAAVGTDVSFEDNIEGNVGNWTVINSPTLTTGAWEQATPIGTLVAGGFAAPNEDAEAGAQNTMCFVTQNGVNGGSLGAADVDGGPTDLISPVIDLAGTDGTITYSRWFYSTNATKVLQVDVTNDGTNWLPVETVTNSGNNLWVVNTFTVSSIITPTSTIQVRFRADDSGVGSIVEAGVDLFRVEEFNCQTCQPNAGLLSVGPATLSLCGDVLASGLSAELKFEGGPANSNTFLGLAVNLNATPIFGGEIISTNPDYLLPVPTNGQGGWSFNVPGGGGPVTVYAQVLYVDATAPMGVGITSAIEATFLP